MDIQIQPLHISTLNSVIALRDAVFPDLGKYEYETLQACLNPVKHQVHKKLGIVELAYWTAIDPNTDSLSGLIGLYTENDVEDTVWLGWYCVDPQYRGQKIGSKLLAFAINEARKQNKKYLSLYTTADEEYTTARIQYEKIGFAHYKSVKKNLFYRLALQN
ncbi:GCN5-related N-acetyltransferase [Sulfuricurvum kujiense DSM 16994]|uniref:GCN5-related N-acetyltransferase n=1 Tax=Sulfuricurvum kujiense (strain ATCC BAA-921 / DSM 16994 / JCM 11577 / YK-1) TaxID=709032 RepID=E4U0X8_SULKY|nr:GNAT family N-acetyltransferase [Sulfuricurvum kujiense]ADR34380.1 GCN5-related N-acetyltransferase [Sulfuricurvum kujiense DSM 16994]